MIVHDEIVDTGGATVELTHIPFENRIGTGNLMTPEICPFWAAPI